MYKKFILNKIESDINREFGYRLRIINLRIMTNISDSESMYFSFETIFKGVTITGYIGMLDDRCQFVKDNNFETVKAFYK